MLIFIILRLRFYLFSMKFFRILNREVNCKINVFEIKSHLKGDQN